MVYVLLLLRAEFSHQHHTDNSANAEEEQESGPTLRAQERHFLAKLVHLSPEGGQVVSALFLGSVLLFASSALPWLLPEKTQEL